jgi:steroid delta-isomerase-like uncharacterized protein
MTDNTTLARSLYDGFNSRDFDHEAALWADEGVMTNVGSGQEDHGPEGSRQSNRFWDEAFPDGRVTVHRVVAADPYVVVEFTGRGTHTGMLTTPEGSIPATGRSVTLEFCDVLQFRDGRVWSRRRYFDSGSMMSQLGLTAEPAQAADQQ